MLEKAVRARGARGARRRGCATVINSPHTRAHKQTSQVELLHGWTNAPNGRPCVELFKVLTDTPNGLACVDLVRVILIEIYTMSFGVRSLVKWGHLSTRVRVVAILALCLPICTSSAPVRDFVLK